MWSSDKQVSSLFTILHIKIYIRVPKSCIISPPLPIQRRSSPHTRSPWRSPRLCPRADELSPRFWTVHTRLLKGWGGWHGLGDNLQPYIHLLKCSWKLTSSPTLYCLEPEAYPIPEVISAKNRYWGVKSSNIKESRWHTKKMRNLHLLTSRAPTRHWCGTMDN